MTDNNELKNWIREVITSYTKYQKFNAKAVEEKNQ